MADTGKVLKVTLTKSGICCPEPHKRILRALGLRKRERSIFRADRPEIRGMLREVSHLVSVEAVPTPPEPLHASRSEAIGKRRRKSAD